MLNPAISDHRVAEESTAGSAGPGQPPGAGQDARPLAAGTGQDRVVWKLDRVVRNTRNLLSHIDDLESLGIHFRSLTGRVAITGPWARRC